MTTSGTSATFSSLAGSTTYSVIVTARNANALTTASGSLSVTTTETPVLPGGRNIPYPMSINGTQDVPIVNGILYTTISNFNTGFNSFCRSTDSGATWFDVTKNFNSSYMVDVVFANGIYVAVGAFKRFSSDTNSSIIYSTDGVNWNMPNDRFGGTASPVWPGPTTTVVTNGSYFVTTAGGVRVSSDGSNWSTSTFATANNGAQLGIHISGLAYNNSVWVITGQHPSGVIFFTSADGLTWSQLIKSPAGWGFAGNDPYWGSPAGRGYNPFVPAPGTSQISLFGGRYDSQRQIPVYNFGNPVSIVSGNGIFLTFYYYPQDSTGTYAPNSWYTDNNVDLTTRTSTTLPASATSTDGVNWSLHAKSDAILFAAGFLEYNFGAISKCVHNGSYWLMPMYFTSTVGSQNRKTIAWSYDAVSWTPISITITGLPTTGAEWVVGVAWNTVTNSWIAYVVKSEPTFTGYVVSSTDAYTWTIKSTWSYN